MEVEVLRKRVARGCAAVLAATVLVASCDSLTRVSRSATLSGVVDQKCIAKAIAFVAESRGMSEFDPGKDAEKSKASLSNPERWFLVPNGTVQILPLDITLSEHLAGSVLAQISSDIGPEHSRESIDKTLALMSEIEGAVAGECDLEIQSPVTEACMARNCPKY